ncbi:hypothetical protein N5D78_09410 [Pseudomonas aeruginosa]|uniref:LysM peptidoglycan-binding domain-containing protein n=1 Tax=Pseudomonas aeruginosa TaxID=287 RepID=UPI0024469A6E|nr:hypothetical protein [Pseudomonas aeruginosa]MDH1323516.1 hypothetical protein [Pseudomonas aeruginosa]
MNKANECSCPSGDGSLVHPCPAHPAVEQAGANVGHGHVFPRADGVKMRCGGPGLCSECTADAYRARAALAQPSPAPDLAERGTTTEQTCRHDFYGVWWNRNGVTKTGRECRYCGFFVEDATEAPAEQAEAERPEVVAVMESNGAGGKRLAQRFPIVNVFVGDELMTVAQHERIVGELRFERQQMDRAFTACINERDAANARLHEVATACATAEQERDAALVRVAELEKQEPVALANRGIHAFWVKWTEAAAGLYGPGIKLYAHPVAQAQHSVPEGFIGRLSEFLAQRGATGKALLRELRDMLAAAPARGQHSVPAYVSYTTRPAESLAGIALRQLKDESRWVEIRDINAHAFPDMQSHSYYPAGTVIKLPAAAPGKEGV